VKPIRVLIVDDSALVRRALAEALSSDPEIEIMATAADPFMAAERIREEIPDVIVLDVKMPRMDGVTFLQTIMTQHPIPVVVCASLADSDSAMASRVMQCGAVEIVRKPPFGTEEFVRGSRGLLCQTVRRASTARLRVLRPVGPALTADAILAPRTRQTASPETEPIVFIGASTGGTEALCEVLQTMPADGPATIIVQHMPEKFTTAFAARLDELCRMRVKEAAGGDRVSQGQALLAPGNQHTLVKRVETSYFVEVRGGPPVRRHRPSVDVLFRSGAHCAGANAVGVLMTGMGDDGARGLLELRQAGAATIAQDEATSVVFGMPHEAIRMGGADRVLPLRAIGPSILEAARERHRGVGR
jgi:two-component system chemotaxis response regulator CheB